MQTSQTPALLVPPFALAWVGGRYYASHIATVITTFVTAANKLYGVPFYVPNQVTLNSINAEVTTLSAGAARLGIYNDSAGAPGSLVLDAGTINTGSTGGKAVAISQLLNPGWYWHAIVFNATPTMRAYSQTNALVFLGFSSNTDTTLHVGVEAAFTYGVLSGADPFPASTLSTTAHPRVLLGV